MIDSLSDKAGADRNNSRSHVLHFGDFYRRYLYCDLFLFLFVVTFHSKSLKMLLFYFFDLVTASGLLAAICLLSWTYIPEYGTPFPSASVSGFCSYRLEGSHILQRMRISGLPECLSGYSFTAGAGHPDAVCLRRQHMRHIIWLLVCFDFHDLIPGVVSDKALTPCCDKDPFCYPVQDGAFQPL